MEPTPLTYEEEEEEEEARAEKKTGRKRSSLCLSEGVFGSSAEAGDGP